VKGGQCRGVGSWQVARLDESMMHLELQRWVEWNVHNAEDTIAAFVGLDCLIKSGRGYSRCRVNSQQPGARSERCQASGLVHNNEQQPRALM